MKSFEFDIAIIGGGCIGSSIMYELSRSSLNSLALIDRGRQTVSATAKSGGMLRVFHESPEHIDLALANLTHIEKLRQSGVLSCQTQANGSLYFFNKRRYFDYESNLRKMDRADYPFEVLTPTSGRERFPEYTWNKDDCAIYEPLGSHLNAQTFVDDLLTASQHRGAHLFDGHEVRRICPHLSRFRIFTDEVTITAKTLILAGGARLLPQLRDMGLNLPLETRKLTTYAANKTDESFRQPNYFDRETLEYGRFGCGPRVILSTPHPQRVTRQIWGEIFEQNTADDCYAPNRLGVTGQVPGHPQLFLATGWGGTAFKFALEVGHRVARTLAQNSPERRTIYADI